MNDLMVFNNPEFGAIRAIEVNEESWFVGRDVAIALGYSKPTDAVIRHVDTEDTLKRGILSRGGNQLTTLINESGVYALIIMSELPSAKKFKRWVTKEVLPSIRKTGGYNLPQMSQNEIIAQMAQANVQFEKRLDCIEQKFEETQDKLETTLKVFTQPSIDHWKADVENSINELVEKYNLSPVAFRGKLYKELESNGIMLQSRLNRLRRRMKKQGYTYKEQMAMTKLDAISKDKQLRIIFENIVKKYQALYGTKSA